METNTRNGRPTKLRTGAWGATVDGAVRAGDTVTIRTAAGKTWQARVASVVWTGNGVTICATESIDRPATSRPATSSRRTGCSCGSREDQYGDLIPSARNCSDCNHDA